MNLNEWFWFSVASILVVFEVLVGTGFFCAWLAASAVILGIIMAVTVALTWQTEFLLFATISGLCIFLWVLQRRYQRRRARAIFTADQGYTTRVFTLEEPVINGRGRLKINDITWSVQGPDLPVGSPVKVIGLEGMILLIDSANTN